MTQGTSTTRFPGAHPALAALLGDLLDTGVRFKHWKSNDRLAESLRCENDLDLLVHRKDAPVLQRVLATHGLRRATDAAHPAYPAIEQYFSPVDAGRRWLHLDVYYAVTTGTSYVKEYHLPLERALLEGDDRLHGVPVPRPAAELMALVVLQMLKRSSPWQLALRRDARGTAATRAEIAAIFERDAEAVAHAEHLLEQYLPQLDPVLWRRCLESLRGSSSWRRRFDLGRRVRASLGTFRRVGPLALLARRVDVSARALLRRRRRHGGSKRLATGGAVVAFVGPEATGKSTMVAMLARRLGEVFDVGHAHLGKPPPTLLTTPIALALPLLRRWKPEARTSVAPTRHHLAFARVLGQDDATEGEHAVAGADAGSVAGADTTTVSGAGAVAGAGSVAGADTTTVSGAGADAVAGAGGEPSWPYVVRSLLLAWDRRALALRLHRTAANGAIVVCDRYPSSGVGAMDSARLVRDGPGGGRDGNRESEGDGERRTGRGPEHGIRSGSSLRDRAAALERRLYRSIPPPTIVVEMTVPLAVALERNRTRVKDRKESDAYLVHRHAHQAVPSFPTATTVPVDTGGELARVEDAVFQAVWERL